MKEFCCCIWIVCNILGSPVAIWTYEQQEVIKIDVLPGQVLRNWVIEIRRIDCQPQGGGSQVCRCGPDLTSHLKTSLIRPHNTTKCCMHILSKFSDSRVTYWLPLIFFNPRQCKFLFCDCGYDLCFMKVVLLFHLQPCGS